MLKIQLILLSVFFIMLYPGMRAYVVSARDYLWSKSSARKYRRGRSVWEWLTFASIRHELPRLLLVFYWTVTLMHPAGMLACLLLAAGGRADIGDWVMGTVLGANVVIGFWSLITFGTGRGNVERRRFVRWMEAWKHRRKKH